MGELASGMELPTDAERAQLHALDRPAIIISSDYVILDVNQAYRTRYGSVVELGRDRCHEVSHRYPTPCHNHGESCPLQACREQGEPSRVTHLHHTPNGPELCEIRMRPLQVEDGQPVRFMEMIRPLESASATGEGMVGASKAFLDLVTQLERAAPADVPVLLLGETGTGKELAARALHDASGRAGAPFVPVECSGLGETLFESELFGAERGAYTGADRRRDGLVAAAEGGTLFLDEIGDVPPALQTRLLRLLESRTYRRVGGTEPLVANFRLVCATHQNLPALVREGRFRRDLYYRIRTFPITLPPLRERRHDVVRLAESFLATRYPGLRLSRAARAALEEHPWPGNIRELRNVVEHAALMCDGALIDGRHLALEVLDEVDGGAGAGAVEPERTLKPMDEVVAEYLRWAAAQEPDRARLAHALGWSERTLYRRLKRLREG